MATPCHIGFDKARRRGVVVLANSYEPRGQLGNLLLESEWQSDRRPQPAKVTSQLCASYAGQYQRSPSFALGMFVSRQYLLDAPRTATLLPAGICLAGLAVLLWRAGTTRKRRLILGSVVLAGVLSAPLLPIVASRIFCVCLHPGIGIHYEGDRLFAQPIGSDLCSIEDWPSAQAWRQNLHPIDVLFPSVPVELLPESETRCFERLSVVPTTFSRDTRGKVTGLALHYHGKSFHYDKISDAPPKATDPLKPTVIVAVNYAKVPKKRPKLCARAVRERDRNRCQYTGRVLRPDEGSLDHVVPRSRGGKDAWENLVWSAKEVNQRKADRLPHEAGLRLLSTPRAPRALPVSALIRNAHRIEDWKLFVEDRTEL